MSPRVTVKTSLPLVPSGPSLADQLRARTAPADLVEPAPEGALRCLACAHACVMEEGRTGSCGVRFVRDGVLHVPYGYVARRYVRAIETNTLFHVRPGARALTFGMFGCDLRCPYCHNWHLSQALREGESPEAPLDITADALVEEAITAGCEAVCAAYNEPMISAEWARAIFERARARGLLTALISDGNTTPRALAYMRPVTDVYRVDLKGYSREQYKVLGGRMGVALDAIREARALGYWVEVVTLVVPGFNDDPEGLRELARELARIDPDLPWHLNAFHPRYKLANVRGTGGQALVSAAGMAYARGLRHVYVSNKLDEVRELSHTRCASCHATVIERWDYTTRSIALIDGHCPACGTAVPGLWGDSASRRLHVREPMAEGGDMP